MALNIPLPNPPAGSFQEGFKNANALSRQLLENQIKGIEAQYKPYNLYADAASKNAYSQFVGPQAIASMLNNPQMRGMLTPEQYQKLASAFANQVSNPVLSQMPMPPNEQQQGNPFTRLLGGIGNLFSGGQQVPQNQNMPQQNMQQQMPQQNIQQGMPQQPPMPPATTPMSGVSPTYDRVSGALTPGTYGATSPQSITQAGEGALKARTEAEAKNIAEQWQKRQDDILESSKAASAASNNIKRMRSAYKDLDKIFETGAFIGKLPAVSDAAQDMDLAANDLMINKLKSWQTSRVTNMDVQLAPSMKPGRYMSEKEFQHAINYEDAAQQRSQENATFSNAAQKAGLSPSEADAVWIRYINERPFYDYNNKKINKDNLDSWEDYLTPDSVRQTFSPSYKKQMNKYESNMYGANEKKDAQISNKFNSELKADGPGVHLLEKDLKIPNFESREKFQEWYQRQPLIVQKAVRNRLGKK